MSTYRYVGSECELDGTKLSRLGQSVTLADDVARIAVIGGAQLLPEDKFDGLDITDEEVKLYPHAGQQRTAPPEFKVKLQAAWVAVAAYKMQLETEGGK